MHLCHFLFINLLLFCLLHDLNKSNESSCPRLSNHVDTDVYLRVKWALFVQLFNSWRQVDATRYTILLL